MALISCPECQKKISDQSTSCPNCGFPLNESKIIVKRPQGCFMQTLNIGCMIILIIGAVLFVVMAIGAYGVNKQKQKKNEINNEKIETEK
ncbi:zinc-ribbon domain-containing protein [Chryseobacterium carnipullorum]|uniref:zinc-ribbon domain-containing protein n=1 Tax=Chryseobacterium carnipullorum TaxID=1124835 RepID=UPI00090F7428|nr:zinc-ribbon domain-containing protein [Chryseobacterium carnipullorum]SHN00885.1 zinc-ribbon domain-containing protein [Chryseobacterium carnipullorum]